MSCSSPTLSKKYFRSTKICILTRFETHRNSFLRAVFMSINTLMSFGMVSVLKIQSYQREVQSILGQFRSKIVVFGGKETEILKIHVRFPKIQIRFHEIGLLPKSELQILSNFREIVKKRNLFFFRTKKKRFGEEHDIAL